MRIVRSQNPFFFFSKKEKETIIQAIREAERQTSGEIRVHLQGKKSGDVIRQASRIFEKLGMSRTEAANGVMIFLRTSDRQFAVIGDRGIHEKVPLYFWDSIAATLSRHFADDRFAEGISMAVGEIGQKLKSCFPHHRADVNELPDEISISF